MASDNSDEVLTDLETEKQHFKDVFRSFAFYRVFAMRRLEQSDRYLAALPAHHLEMLQPDIGQRQKLIKTAIDVNFEFIREMLQSSKDMFSNSSVSQDVPDFDDRSGTCGHQHPRGDEAAPGNDQTHGSRKQKRPAHIADEPEPFTMDKVMTTLKQFYRDWSAEGVAEREACYGPIITQLKHYCPLPSEEDAAPPRVLVPGAGLGRLVFDLALLGYECQGNEWSMHMLIASNFIINRSADAQKLTIHPWALNFCNNVKTADQLMGFKVPDAVPALVLSPSFRFSMSAGNFLEVYTEPESWDCVVTCFFLDTAHNPLAYIECIHNILTPGGIWINHGPLLWHWSDTQDQMSIELSYEQIRRVLKEKFHFNLLMEEVGVRSGYIQNPLSMMKTLYDSVLFVAQKPPTITTTTGDN